MDEELKKCNRCKERKPLDQFYRFTRDDGILYTRPDCKHCFNRMLNQNKRKKRFNELTGRKHPITKKRTAYQRDREQILERKRIEKGKFSKEVESALLEAELVENMDVKDGKNKSRKNSHTKQGATKSPVRRNTRRSKDSS